MGLEYLLYSEAEILERVDEYTLYCFYLGYQPLIGAKYHSPIRRALGLPDDDNPSFGIYESTSRVFVTHEFMWKDSGQGGAGDVFKLIQLMYRYETKREALLRAMADFGIGGYSDTKAVYSEPVEKIYTEPAYITIRKRDFRGYDYSFWNRFNVDRKILERYNTKPFSAYWMTQSQTTPNFPKGLAYAYQIWDKYQLYFPELSKKRKFRNDWAEACVPGYLQLEYNSPLLIITKAMKDVMSLRSFGYEAIAPRGENILVPKECVALMKRKYERILVLFDNDLKHKGDEYEFKKIYVPQPDKDISDFCSSNGPQATAELLRHLAGN